MHDEILIIYNTCLVKTCPGKNGYIFQTMVRAQNLVSQWTRWPRPDRTFVPFCRHLREPNFFRHYVRLVHSHIITVQNKLAGLFCSRLETQNFWCLNKKIEVQFSIITSRFMCADKSPRWGIHIIKVWDERVVYFSPDYGNVPLPLGSTYSKAQSKHYHQLKHMQMTRHRSREGSFAYSLRVLLPPLREASVFSTVSKHNLPSHS